MILQNAKQGKEAEFCFAYICELKQTLTQVPLPLLGHFSLSTAEFFSLQILWLLFFELPLVPSLFSFFSAMTGQELSEYLQSIPTGAFWTQSISLYDRPHLQAFLFPAILHCQFTAHSNPEVSLGIIHSQMHHILINFNKAAFVFYLFYFNLIFIFIFSARVELLISKKVFCIFVKKEKLVQELLCSP